MNKIALITGATSGIGYASAEKFAQNNYDLIITGRRKERLDAFSSELSSKYGIDVLTLAFDVREKEAVELNITSLKDKWKNIDVLVNNAGLALGLSTIDNGDIENWETMIDTNIKGLLYMTKFVSKMMISSGKGHIINVGSIAGKEVYPNGNVYCATKHAVDALTKATRIDLLQYGIKVSQIAPGAVETEFSEVRFHGDKQRAKEIYKGFQPLTGKDIAEVIYYITTLPAHVNINDLLIMPTAQANATTLLKK